MNSSNDVIKDLNRDEIFSLIFMILNVFTILGDEFLKKYYTYKNVKCYKNAKKLFLASLVITFFIYFYFIKKNKYNYYNKIINNQESFPTLVRLIGSILLICGIVCLIYYQVNDNDVTGAIPV